MISKKLVSVLLIIALLLTLTGCGKSDKCPICNGKVDYSKDIFCSNCGYSFASAKPEGYSPAPEITQSNEEKGVPDEIIHKEIDEHLNSLLNYAATGSCTVDIEHNVNTTTHIDTAYAHLTVTTEFGTETNSIMFEFQYDRSSDLWTKLGESDWQYKFVPDSSGFLGEWELSMEEHDIYYNIVFHGIDEYGAEIDYLKNSNGENIDLYHEYFFFSDHNYIGDRGSIELRNEDFRTCVYLDIAGLHFGYGNHSSYNDSFTKT